MIYLCKLKLKWLLYKEPKQPVFFFNQESNTYKHEKCREEPYMNKDVWYIHVCKTYLSSVEIDVNLVNLITGNDKMFVLGRLKSNQNEITNNK